MLAQETSFSAGTVSRFLPWTNSTYLPQIVARGSSVLAKSVTPSRIDENRKLVSLDAADMAALDSIHEKKGLTRYVWPPFGVSLTSKAMKPSANTVKGEAGLPGQALTLLREHTT